MRSRLLLTWLALLLLLALTAGSALLHLGAWNGAINFGVAAAKGLLVAFVFMRLAGGAVVLRVAAVTGLLTLALLFGLWSADYATRAPQAAPYQSPGAVAPRLGAAAS
jgi:cytochrome c oxidase subunit 4